tara:strand:- start:169 stop:333 length:165 start_codon:yes stop_codon:yes gene_type:complete
MTYYNEEENLTPHMDKILKSILADFRRICVENADDPMVKSTVQTLNDTKVVKKE